MFHPTPAVKSPPPPNPGSPVEGAVARGSASLRTRLGLAAAVAAAVSMLSACAPALPPAPPPLLPIPSAWPPGTQQTQSGAQAQLPAWRSYFTDPLLQHLVQTALDNNRDLRSAMLRVDEARAALQIQISSLYPEVGLGAQGARTRLPGDLNPTGRPVTGGEYRAQVGTSSWELDLWGRVRSLEESALRQWLASDAGSQAARTALIAQVANGYLGLRELQERVALAQRALQSRQESCRIFKRRVEVGSASRLELTQVHVLWTQARSMLAQLEQARSAQVHALGLLIGTDPGPLPFESPFDETTVLAELSPGLPSELLGSRPDIIAAEHRLAAARANVAAARAAFFPRIALTASAGTASAELGGLFSPGSRSWTFAPVLSLPIFDAGRRQAGLDVAAIRRDLAVAEYEKSIQTAFREALDALTAQRWLAENLGVQRAALASASERARLAKLRYDHGSTTYLEVLDAQRDLLAAEQQLVQARRQLLSNQVALYAALGGGARTAPALVPTPLRSTATAHP